MLCPSKEINSDQITHAFLSFSCKRNFAFSLDASSIPASGQLPDAGFQETQAFLKETQDSLIASLLLWNNGILVIIILPLYIYHPTPSLSSFIFLLLLPGFLRTKPASSKEPLTSFGHPFLHHFPSIFTTNSTILLPSIYFTIPTTTTTKTPPSSTSFSPRNIKETHPLHQLHHHFHHHLHHLNHHQPYHLLLLVILFPTNYRFVLRNTVCKTPKIPFELDLHHHQPSLWGLVHPTPANSGQLRSPPANTGQAAVGLPPPSFLSFFLSFAFLSFFPSFFSFHFLFFSFLFQTCVSPSPFPASLTFPCHSLPIVNH